MERWHVRFARLAVTLGSSSRTEALVRTQPVRSVPLGPSVWVERTSVYLTRCKVLARLGRELWLGQLRLILSVRTVPLGTGVGEELNYAERGLCARLVRSLKVETTRTMFRVLIVA